MTAPTPLIRLPHVPDGWRDAIGVCLVVGGAVLIAAGLPFGGAVAGVLGALALARRRLRAKPGWDAKGAGWVPVTADEVGRVRDLLHARHRWARDPWHVAGGAGFLVWLGVSGAAAGVIAGVLLGIDPALAGRLGLAAVVVLLPPFLAGGRAAAEPDGLGADVEVTRDVLDAIRERPEPTWQPVPELLLATAGEGRSVPAGARLRLHLSPDPPALRRGWIERTDGNGRPRGRAVFRLVPSTAVRATVAALGPGYTVSSGADHLQVQVDPGDDLLERVTHVADQLQSSPLD